MSTTTPITNYFVVPAPGYYADKARVLSAHRTLQAARRAAAKWPDGLVVRKGHKSKGERFLRVYEETYPEVE